MKNVLRITHKGFPLVHYVLFDEDILFSFGVSCLVEQSSVPGRIDGGKSDMWLFLVVEKSGIFRSQAAGPRFRSEAPT